MQKLVATNDKKGFFAFPLYHNCYKTDTTPYDTSWNRRLVTAIIAQKWCWLY